MMKNRPQNHPAAALLSWLRIQAHLYLLTIWLPANKIPAFLE